MAKKVAIFILLSCIHSASAQTITWSGRQWKVTTGGMAGVAKGDPTNVSIDDQGYLHLRIVERDGKWTASEVFTVERFGFGTYQWIVEGNVYDMNRSSVLGLFPYGPIHHVGFDAENEIDIEFSKWNNTCHGCNADFTVYPSTGNRKQDGTSAWEDNFRVSGGAITTARIEWAPEHVVFTLMNDAHAIGATAEVIKAETPATTQSVIIRSFEFTPK